MKLVIISHEPFRNKMYQDFFMDKFKEDGFDVAYWCIQTILSYSRNGQYHHKESGEEVRYFHDRSVFMAELKRLDHTTVVCLDIWFVNDTINILKVLKDAKVKLFKIDYFRNQPIIQSKKDKLLKSLKSLDFTRLLRAVIHKTSNTVFRVSKQLIGLNLQIPIFVPGNVERFNDQNLVSITHFDVGSYEKSTLENPELPYPYYVFLDIYLPYHPDLSRDGLRSIEPTKYFDNLRVLFDDLEKKTGNKVVIAAHPKARYTDEFGDRPSFYGKTPELVRGCSGVLSHHSAAINFAVLNQKPLVLIFSSEFTNASSANFLLGNMYDIMRGYASELGCDMINMESESSFRSLDSVDVDMYDKYKRKYLLSTYYPKSNFAIIKERLQLN